jgi:hypothetical protein
MATITRIISDGRFPERHSYRVEGTDISAEWVSALEVRTQAFPRYVRPALPSCEFTIWYGGDQLGSYSGAVWPTAWPALFTFSRGTAQTGSATYLTAEGRRLVAAAERAWWERAHSGEDRAAERATRTESVRTDASRNDVPEDYESCGACGYDHAYESAEAARAHAEMERACVRDGARS